jgi:hypothetical protein
MGHYVDVDAEHVRWLERLSAATQQSIDDLRDDSRHDHSKMIRSLEALRERIRVKLRDQTSSGRR